MNCTNLEGTKLTRKLVLEKGTQECSVYYCAMRNGERTGCMIKCHVLMLWYSDKMCYRKDLELWLPWCIAGFPVLNVGPIKVDVWPNLYKYSKRLVVICWIPHHDSQKHHHDRHSPLHHSGNIEPCSSCRWVYSITYSIRSRTSNILKIEYFIQAVSHPLCVTFPSVGFRTSKLCCTRYSKKQVPFQNIRGYRQQLPIEHCRISAIM